MFVMSTYLPYWHMLQNVSDVAVYVVSEISVNDALALSYL